MSNKSEGQTGHMFSSEQLDRMEHTYTEICTALDLPRTSDQIRNTIAKTIFACVQEGIPEPQLRDVAIERMRANIKKG